MKKFFFGVIATVLVSIASSAQGTGRVNPVEVGQLHNVYLSMGVKNAMDRDLSPHDAFLLVDFPNLTKDEESKIFEFFASKSYGEMKAQILTSFKDAKAVEYYNQIERAIDESTSISELNGKLEVIKANVN